MNKSFHHPRAVVQLDAVGNLIAEYPSLSEAARALDIKSIANVANCCRGRRYNKTVKGFRFVYKDEYDPSRNYACPPLSNCKPVIQLTYFGKEVARYPSLRAAATAIGVKSTVDISLCCHKKRASYHGYCWKFADDSVR